MFIFIVNVFNGIGLIGINLFKNVINFGNDYVLENNGIYCFTAVFGLEIF